MITLIVASAPFLILAFILAIGVGANDETFAPVVGARRLTPLQCVLIGAVIAIIGALTLGGNVAGTIGTDITDLILTEGMIFSVLLAMSIVLILSSGFGLPISSTHAMVGSITGIALWNNATVNSDKLISIFLSWFVSPALGLIISFVIYKLVDVLTYKTTSGLTSVERNESIAANFLLLFVMVTALSRGGNDVANAVSPLIGKFITEDGDFSSIPLLVGGIGMAFGLILLARRVLATLGNDIVEMTAPKALAVQISTASITFVGANLGIPLSGTHILVASFIGVAMSSRSRVNMKLVQKIGVSAISTPFIGAVLSIVLYSVVAFLGYA